MPIYEYKCGQCDAVMEIQQRITEEPLTKCPKCGGPLKKLISSTSFVLKGSGWYVTDYPSKERQAPTSSESHAESHETSADKSSETKAETTATEPSATKSDAPAKEPAGV
ncbi:MAG: hypothetical protein L7F77_04615 [Candidatus Magnetominusculus sp. LBB02]|nr:hypothetical protein [Candidatus Magnetominusculus sp. LBB02]